MSSEMKRFSLSEQEYHQVRPIYLV